MLKELSNIKNNGFSLLEVILALSLFGLLLTALGGMFFYVNDSVVLAGARARAVMLATEGLEAVRNIRDADFSSLSPGTHGLAISSNQWIFSGVSDTTDIFTREIIITNIDAERKSITTNVTWAQNLQRSGTVSFTTYLTDWARRVVGDWSNPFQESAINVAGAQNGVKVQVVGDYAYLVRADGTPDFLVINISNPASPATVGSLNLAGVPSNIFVAGNYAYVTNNSNTDELQIINISNPASPSLVASYNDAGNEDARGVYVDGNYAYMVFNAGNDIVVVDVTNPASPIFTGGLVLNGTAYEVYVTGTYAYVASDDNSQELQVVNISNPASLTLSGSLNLAGNTNAITIAGEGSNVFLGQGSNLRVVSITTPTTPVLLGSVSTVGNANDIALNTGNDGAYLFVATSTDAGELRVIDISTPASPVDFGFFDTTGTDDLAGVAYEATLDRAFGASAGDAQEFIVFAPN